MAFTSAALVADIVRELDWLERRLRTVQQQLGAVQDEHLRSRLVQEQTAHLNRLGAIDAITALIETAWPASLSLEYLRERLRRYLHRLQCSQSLPS
ncbi:MULTISPECIES: hypothetical protein [unclassified Synechococcus]|uniref:hypothetical protein n=1 Tax=unclassified Synechococcus TaxID=2626047 RepID=UPI0013C30BF4|nr:MULTISPECIES: hypothetical protein [unclassified Synechococcus]